VDVVTPFYTHLDAEGREQGILVNRGWVPHDLKDLKMHYTTNSIGTINGVLYRGDAKTKYSKLNSPTIGHWESVHPEELSLLAQLPNQQESSQMMLHMIDLEEERRQLLPTVPSKKELTSFVINPERHAAYEMLWRGLAFTGVLANTALWIYF